MTPEESKNIQIIFASASGNVAAVCEKVAEILNANGFVAQLHRAESTKFELIAANQLFIFATSTWEHGVISPYFEPLLKEISKNSVEGKYAGFIGLGDTRYEPVLFCGGMITLQETFEKQGGTSISVPLKINGDPYSLLDNMVTDWTKKFISDLSNFNYRKAENDAKSVVNNIEEKEEAPKDISI